MPFYSQMFKNAQRGTILNKIWEKNGGNDSTSYFVGEEDGLEMLLKEEYTALYYQKEGLMHASEYRCEVLVPWETNYPGFLSMAFPKNSTYFPFFHYQTVRHFENGVIFALRNRWTTYRLDHCSVNEPQPLGLEKLISLFGLLGMAAVCASVIFSMEKLTGHMANKITAESKRAFLNMRPELMAKLNDMMVIHGIANRNLFIYEVQKIVHLASKSKKEETTRG